jgi:hypothetical protein
MSLGPLHHSTDRGSSPGGLTSERMLERRARHSSAALDTPFDREAMYERMIRFSLTPH